MRLLLLGHFKGKVGKALLYHNNDEGWVLDIYDLEVAVERLHAAEMPIFVIFIVDLIYQSHVDKPY